MTKRKEPQAQVKKPTYRADEKLREDQTELIEACAKVIYDGDVELAKSYPIKQHILRCNELAAQAEREAVNLHGKDGTDPDEKKARAARIVATWVRSIKEQLNALIS